VAILHSVITVFSTVMPRYVNIAWVMFGQGSSTNTEDVMLITIGLVLRGFLYLYPMEWILDILINLLSDGLSFLLGGLLMFLFFPYKKNLISIT